ncbi:MAG: CDP-diacylglycerol--serine O-phosphatidyltransferase [Thermodesulfobacteriota bacterium]|nr:CDP-diacylglycerol--serine O-phosphatidyltransferase [Thermodesulfobacteriota bacterium]
MKKQKHEKERLRRGIYVLPNLFTTLNLFCGFFSIMAAINGQFTKSALYILAGMVFDTLDGKVARATRTTSQFGIEYDSLADLISFGLAPGIMVYLWILAPFGKLGWLAALLFLACGALRLARFNTNINATSSNHFTGLPIPAAAGTMAAIVLFSGKLGIAGPGINIYIAGVILGGMYALSFLMVSSIKYTSFKTMPPILVKAKHFNLLVTAVLLLIFIVQEPVVAIFSLMILYIVSGPLLFVRRLFGSSEVDEEEDEEAEEMFSGDDDFESTVMDHYTPYRS